jgi:hypothetical protein
MHDYDLHPYIYKLTGSKLTKDVTTGIYELSVIWVDSEWTACYVAELFITATVVETNATNLWYWFSSIPSSTAEAASPLAAATFFIYSVAPEFFGPEPTASIPAGTAAATNGASTATSATATATAAAAATAAATATCTTTIATTITFASAAAVFSKDAWTHRPEVHEFDRITARCYCIWYNYTRGEFEPRNRSD